MLGPEQIAYLLLLCESVSPILQEYSKSVVYDAGSLFVKKILDKKKLSAKKLMKKWFERSIRFYKKKLPQKRETN